MPRRAGYTAQPVNLIAYENGFRWDEWAHKVEWTGGDWHVPTLFGYQGDPIGWRNNHGRGEGAACFRLSATAFSLLTDATYRAQHMVSIRLTRVLDHPRPVLSFGIGPATALTSTGAGYALKLNPSGGKCYLRLYKSTGSGWVGLTWGTALTVDPKPGDILTLGYQIVKGTGNVRLYGRLNGVKWSYYEDSSSPHDIESGTKYFGLAGFLSPFLSNTRAGDVIYEWWVIQGHSSLSDQAIEEPPSTTDLAKGLRIAILKRQRFSDDPEPTIAKLLSGELLACSWSHKRIGGCATLDARFKLPDMDQGLLLVPQGVYVEPIETKSFDDPPLAEWESSDWLGGEVVLQYHYFVGLLDPAPATQLSSRNAVWRGRLAKLLWNPDTKEVTIQAEGLVADLDTINIYAYLQGVTIRNIIKALVVWAAKTGRSNWPWGGDTYIRYNPAKIIGLQSAMDMKITMDFQNVSAMSAIQKVFEYFPPGAVWGVDAEGDFFLDQQLEHYTADLTGTGIQHFTVDNDLVRFTKTVDFSRIRNQLAVIGKEMAVNMATGKPDQAVGVASCDRSRELFGLRQAIQMDSSVPDGGACAKIAAAQLKPLVLPAITGTLVVSKPVTNDREMWQSLYRGAPRIAVDDCQNTTGLVGFGGGILGYSSTEYLLRRMGDVAAAAPDGYGSGGASLSWVSNAASRLLDKSWLFHAALRFDRAHPGAAGDVAYLVGRATSQWWGWGSLVWTKVAGSPETGKLEWRYYDAVNGLQTVDLGISVPPAGAGLEVHLTIWRDATGDWRAYDGASLTATDATKRTHTPLQSAHPWTAFVIPILGSPPLGICGNVVMDQLWLMDTVALETDNSGEVAAFIVRQNARYLARHATHGLLMWAPLWERLVTGQVSANYPIWSAGAVITGTFIPETVGANEDPVTTTNAATGVQLGEEKKWGGPLVFNAESVAYTVDPQSGVLTRDYVLGEIPPNLFALLSVLRDEIRRMNEEDRAITVGRF